MSEMTPRQVVEQLSQHIIGQDAAKRAMAIALRNRWRWLRLSDEMRREVTPRNILMIGPTGVGKTEITRRLATMTGAPFIKVEATKYTEVGYHGRDVESMIRDLVEAAIGMVRGRRRREIESQALQRVEERLLRLLIPGESPVVAGSGLAEDSGPADGIPPYQDDHDENSPGNGNSRTAAAADPAAAGHAARARYERTLATFRDMLRDGKLEERMVELAMEQRSSPVQVFSNMGLEQMDLDLQGMLEKMLPKKQTPRRVTVREARRMLLELEVDGMLDKDSIHEEAIRLTESSGMIFIDEIDKICSAGDAGKSADVSRQGVQRDLLPIVEGTTVNTRYGHVSTEKIMFIAAGAFHRARPSDLMPELQGRFPIRVELQDLTRNDLVRILTEPAGSLTRQYTELLAVDDVTLEFSADGIDAIADVAFQVNQTTQNIGARRLQTILERLLEDVSFNAPDGGPCHVRIDRSYVHEKLDSIRSNEDLSRFVL